jgi:hypothetical protein
MTRLSTKAREKLYDAEAAKARAAGRGDLPICNICDCPIDGKTQAWHESHDPTKPRWLGGEVTGIAHERCNLLHNNQHDTPLFAKNNRQRQGYIGAKVSAYRPMPGTKRSGIRKPMRPYSDPVDRRTGQPWRGR